MKIEFQSSCDIGAHRANNEDAVRYAQSKNGSLVWAVIADGMGGHLAGEIASNMLVTHIDLAINSLESFEGIDWCRWIELELNQANDKIFAASQMNPEQKGMGTTAVLTIIYQQKCYIGWVGDSRGYLFDANEQTLTQLTVDHTMVQALLDKGAITIREAETSNNKNMLSRAIGIKRGVEVDSKQIDIRARDVVFLSTDGLHDSLSATELSFHLQQLVDGTDISQQIIKQSIKNGSKDNITFASIFINK